MVSREKSSFPHLGLDLIAANPNLDDVCIDYLGTITGYRFQSLSGVERRSNALEYQFNCRTALPSALPMSCN